LNAKQSRTIASQRFFHHMSRTSPPTEGALMSSKAAALGNLPEWNLADLYASPAASEFSADLKRGEAEAWAFSEQYRGKLATLSGEELAKAVRAYEALSDLLGRVGSYAQLNYVGDTTDRSVCFLEESRRFASCASPQEP